MYDLKLFELFGEIDEKIVQQANDDLNFWHEAHEGVVVRAGSPRRSPLRIALASVACAVVVFGAVFLLRNVLKNGFMYGPAISDSSSVQSGENSVAEIKYTLNSDVMWALGKTVDEVAERYGEITGDSDMGSYRLYQFKNGYGRYSWYEEDGGCKVVGSVSARDLLTGDLSTVTLDNMASKYGLENYSYDLHPISLDDDDYGRAIFTHPSYGDLSFIMTFKKNGSDFDKDDTDFLIKHADTSVPSGEPTFLIGPDGNAILTSEITRLENTDKTAETLTEDDLWADIYCDGFAYYKEPCGIGYDNYKNPEMFGKMQYGTFYIGEEPENTNEWKRVYVGDEIFGLKVRSATAHFAVNDWDNLKFPARYFYDNANGIELEGTIEVEGYLQVLNYITKYPTQGGLMFFYPAVIDLPLDPGASGPKDEETGFTTSFGKKPVYNHIDEFMCAGEFGDIGLGYIADANCDMDGLGVGDIAYARVTLSNITCYGNGAAATLEKVELLSEILAHDDDDPGIHQSEP